MGSVHLRPGATVGEQAVAEFHQSLEDYPYASMPASVWQRMNIGVDTPVHRFSDRFIALKGIPGASEADFMKAWWEPRAVGEVVIDLDALLLDHRIQQVSQLETHICLPDLWRTRLGEKRNWSQRRVVLPRSRVYHRGRARGGGQQRRQERRGAR